MITAATTLTLFIMLGIASLAIFWAKRINIPHTVLLVAIGISLGLLSYFPSLAFLGQFQLTPELLFYIFLPTLIFESAYNMNVRRLVDDYAAVLLLSIGGFLISTIVITVGLHALLLAIGLVIPIPITLLFGALISATDPVAILALFKEYGAPKRLTLIFEGESLFNDATAVALFLITLEAIHQDVFSVATSLSGLLLFVSMLIGGVIFGLVVGGLFAFLIGTTRESEVASITLTLVLAHITFILAELLSTTPVLFGQVLPISPIISTTIASLLIGNYGRAKIHPRAEKFVSELWEQFAFMANSLVFILIGVLMSQTSLLSPTILLATIIAIIVVAFARAASIYPVVFLYNLFQTDAKRIPPTWQHLLAWGSLRGALAVTMVLLIPDDFMISGWTLAIAPKEFLLALTVGCIGATLFIKATTIKPFIKRFNIDALSRLEEVEYQEARALIHYHVQKKLNSFQERKYIDAPTAQRLLTDHEAAFTKACQQVDTLSHDKRERLSLRTLRIFAIGIEKQQLKNLYRHNEINETVFRRISGKLQLQLEAIESGDMAPDIAIHTDSRDVFERLATYIRTIFKPTKKSFNCDDRYMYYRAQSIISRKVVKEFTALKEATTSVFSEAELQDVIDLYKTFKQNSHAKLQQLIAEAPKDAERLAFSLAEHSVHKIEETILQDLYNKELISQKLYIALRDELLASK